MRVETGGDENHLRPVRFQRGQATPGKRITKGVAAASRRQRNVVHVRTRRIDTGVRVQRILERSRHHDARIVGEDIFGAIAVMHVEVDHRCAFNAVLRQRMSHADGNVVEQAEAHGVRAHGVVSGRPHCAKCGATLAACHQIGG